MFAIERLSSSERAMLPGWLAAADVQGTYRKVLGDKLLGPRLKLARAKQHIGDLDREVRYFANRKPYRLILEASPNPISMVSITVRIREEIPQHFAPIIGDIVHNLRSTLDHLAAALIPNGGDDPAVQFPFTNSVDTLPTTIRKRHIDRADPRAVDLIRQMKPYKGGNDALHGLRALDNTDKHRLLIPVLSHTGIKSLIVRNGEVAFDLADFVSFVGVKDGQIVAGLPMPGNMKLGDEIEPTFAIAFGDGPFANVEVLGWLSNLGSYLEAILNDFEPFAI